MPKNKTIKIVIDTNLWISFIISNRYKVLDPFLLHNKLRILFSDELVHEITDTIGKPKLKKYFGPEALEEMLSNFEPYIDLVQVKSKEVKCRDVKDNFLLSLAKDGKADYILTGDKDLLDLKKVGKTKIETISVFVTEMNAKLKLDKY